MFCSNFDFYSIFTQKKVKKQDKKTQRFVFVLLVYFKSVQQLIINLGKETSKPYKIYDNPNQFDGK